MVKSKLIIVLVICLLLSYVSFGMYDVKTGRFMQQDPLGTAPRVVHTVQGPKFVDTQGPATPNPTSKESQTSIITVNKTELKNQQLKYKEQNQYIDSMNLYQYVKSNPVNYTDPSGMMAIPSGGGEGLGGCSTETCIESCKNLGGNMQDCENKCLDAWSKFNEWYNGPHPTYGGLPSCPCKLNKCLRYDHRRHRNNPYIYSNPDPKVWALITVIETPWYLGKYHPVASYDMRSKGRPSQQCTYDSSGNLITHGIGAGTVDSCYAREDPFEHRKLDVNAADWAMFLDGNPKKWPSDDGPCFKKYIEKRPTDNGNNCPENP